MYKHYSIGFLVAACLLLNGCDTAKKENNTAPEPASQQVFQQQEWSPMTRDLVGFGDNDPGAIKITESVYQARGTANMTMIITDAGNIIVDTGLRNQAKELKRRLDQISSNTVSHAILTHAHADHYSGMNVLDNDKPEVIAHREFLYNQQYITDLMPYLMPRNHIFYPEDVPNLPAIGYRALKEVMPIVEPTVVIDSAPYAFELGGKQFVVYHTPGAEGYDNISLWMPEQKILFSGDLFGHMFGMWPNFTTMRGERARFPRPYIESLNLVLELEPEIIVPSHFYPVKGADYIRSVVTKTRDAVSYVDDAVIDGMNDGKDVFTLMEEIQLPEELYLFEAHGKVSWGVRSFWEAYTGWFALNSATEMYSVPVTDTYPELYQLAGGSDAILQLADAKLNSGELEKSLHLIEMVQQLDASNAEAKRLKLTTLNALLQRSGSTNHHEVMFLQRLIAEAEEEI
ncbi:Putative alkyl/aryl-sulfatase YjcS [Sinobacterium norvegicum]|uniref:Alkyl/aryl-sulfatase YjcS n=1 Tax=Sinobacterium norvegicum TaxID=1641715 RepID=A0ABN8EFH5_9GAMM|nr:MBL fold metallo-hydrolase [Sinobacterium norvegicum]CAH0991169.1 Putative alkyl/aryl-sulfatase YjcS [Sinobacterium norvegicum]